MIDQRLRRSGYNGGELSRDRVEPCPLHKSEQQMTAREKLIQAIQTLPESQVDRVLAYINQIMADDRRTQEQDSQAKPCFDETWWNNLSQFSSDFLEVSRTT
ncbi:hypothetical protein [Phormidium sp. CCY1219]|uniref:hypothetical protein n=1 Tax=Phormidium sp. CCY1219 TaxID=2886104 RepID=UPI002D1F1768|nr:hypothetical protein [Phormidium sp. CCY1219]MEB3829927.1 hypothetical protein [Phormidium sp. CCY1219]